jgi:hemerythrin-like domain-containing protein
MKKDTILDLMVANHALLEALFSVFSDNVKSNLDEANDSLKELIWETKKHFFTEEQAVFSILSKENAEVYKIVKHLIEEHKTMVEMLDKMTKKIEMADVDEYAKMLGHHREMEEKDLYPRLDAELPEELKRQVIARVNEIPLTPEL